MLSHYSDSYKTVFQYKGMKLESCNEDVYEAVKKGETYTAEIEIRTYPNSAKRNTTLYQYTQKIISNGKGSVIMDGLIIRKNGWILFYLGKRLWKSGDAAQKRRAFQYTFWKAVPGV